MCALSSTTEVQHQAIFADHLNQLLEPIKIDLPVTKHVRGDDNMASSCVQVFLGILWGNTTALIKLLSFLLFFKYINYERIRVRCLAIWPKPQAETSKESN